MFIRKIDESIMEALQSHTLYSKKLISDIKDGIVFPAIRDNRIDFYHKGGRLFSFGNGKQFQTHKKYASVILYYEGDADANGNIYENQMQKTEVRAMRNFLEGYQRIKENCSQYSGVEAQGVSQIYGKFSYANEDCQSQVVVLDIEVSFKSQDNDYITQDRIDLLLFNKKTKTLRFYEAKHFSNNDIWSKEETPPKVTRQIDTYKKQLSSRKDHIKNVYSGYIDTVNRLFRINMPSPAVVDDNIGLIIFGFDDDQKKGRLKRLFLDDKSFKLLTYPIGDISQVKLINLWNGTT
jgi:hypothetical protein